MGVNINGERFNHLRFAYDIIIISSESLEEMEIMLLESWQKASEKWPQNEHAED